MRTIGTALREHRGSGPGFDALRLTLAFSVLAWHCFSITSGDQASPTRGIGWMIVYATVPMFFALSGFLVTPTAARLTLGRFVLARALRIAPPLMIGTAACVLVLGLAVTTLPRLTYLSDPLTLAYWRTALCDIHYLLPGVFTDNPLPQVNASLWTIPGEIVCYAVLAGLILVRRIGWWPAPVLGIGILFAVDLAWRAFGARWSFPFEKQFAGESGKLICIFLVGALAWLQRDRIPLSPILAGLAAGGLALFTLFGSSRLATNLGFVAFACVALTYLVIWLGMLNIPLPWPFNTGSYSYGLYLYGFPIQQAVVHITGTRSPLVVLALALPVGLLMAFLSWHGIEKPTQDLRRRISRSARRADRDMTGSDPNGAISRVSSV